MTDDAARCPYLLLAHHRSGSNFLNDLLQAHPHIECINEPLSMHTRYFRDCDLAAWHGDDFDPQLLHHALAPHPALRSFLADLRDYLGCSSRGRVIGFKETVLFGKLDWLGAFLPTLKVLFLKRDPRAIVSSVLRSNLAGLWNYSALVPPAFRKLFPHYGDTQAHGDPATAAAEIVAMSVAARYELARRTLQRFDHLVVHLDEVTHQPQQCLDAITRFLGVEPHEEPLRFLRERQAASRGGPFSSFRKQEDVENTWQQHLLPGQVQVIEHVLAAAPAEAVH
jgi:hypothetical protein